MAVSGVHHGQLVWQRQARPGDGHLERAHLRRQHCRIRDGLHAAAAILQLGLGVHCSRHLHVCRRHSRVVFSGAAAGECGSRAIVPEGRIQGRGDAPAEGRLQQRPARHFISHSMGDPRRDAVCALSVFLQAGGLHLPVLAPVLHQVNRNCRAVSVSQRSRDPLDPFRRGRRVRGNRCGLHVGPHRRVCVGGICVCVRHHSGAVHVPHLWPPLHDSKRYSHDTERLLCQRAVRAHHHSRLGRSRHPRVSGRQREGTGHRHCDHRWHGLSRCRCWAVPRRVHRVWRGRLQQRLLHAVCMLPYRRPPHRKTCHA
mmetsp:Transcript_34824/g.87725  ORF Transcript_34824/g.87725 Transcript_34824/m.87725 type:complete len:312 (+) Transcript_34824:605-1540(+)